MEVTSFRKWPKEEWQDDSKIRGLKQQGRNKMTKKLHAEWIQWAKAYRLYDPKNPQETVAYAENMIENIMRFARRARILNVNDVVLRAEGVG